jgi:hypothetical protein
MKNFKKYSATKQLVKRFENDLHFYGKEAEKELCNFYADQLNLSTTDLTVGKIRSALAARCKYWKTVCRYPVKSYEILLTGLQPDVKLNFDIKFPQKCELYNADWIAVPPNVIVNVTNVDDQLPKLGMRIQDGQMAIALCYFKTTSAYQNKKIKEYLHL